MQHRVGSQEIVCEKGGMTQKEKLGQREILPSLVAEQSWIAALLLMRSYRSKLSTLCSQDLPRRPAGHSGGDKACEVGLYALRNHLRALNHSPRVSLRVRCAARGISGTLPRVTVCEMETLREVRFPDLRLGGHIPPERVSFPTVPISGPQ